MPLIHINTVLAVSSSLTKTQRCWRVSWRKQPLRTWKGDTLEKEIENALQRGATDHLAISDLIFRKLIVAEEIKRNRRLVELIRTTQT